MLGRYDIEITRGNYRKVTTFDMVAHDEPPRSWVQGVRRGEIDYECTNRVLVSLHDVPITRYVFRDESGRLFVRDAGGVTVLPWDAALRAQDGLQVFGAEWCERRMSRRRQGCTPMPAVLGVDEVSSVLQWPLGKVMTSKARGEGWTDCVLHLRDDIRVGGSHNSRRARFDGEFYVTHKGGRVPLSDELAARVQDVARHVYGADSARDREHNKTLKGY